MRQPFQTLVQLLQFDGNWWNYYQKHKASIRQVVVENIIKMMSCGKTIQGYATYAGENAACSHQKIVPFTCKSRCCPSCGKKATAQWIHQQMHILPKTRWQHITFTMPNSLWRLFDLNRHLLNELSPLAASCLLNYAKHRGIPPAFFTALHTFGRELKWNVLVHLSVTLGGLNADHSQWENIYFKKKTIMRCWRYRIIARLQEAYRNGKLSLPDSLADYCKDEKAFSQMYARSIY
jgi:hypothetical protein